MSSSQGVNADTVSGYPFELDSLRDASDWIRHKKQTRLYQNYKSASTDNKDTSPVWMKYGNDIRTTYNFGRLECDTCQGNAFRGAITDVITDTPLPNTTIVVDLTGLDFTVSATQFIQKFTLLEPLTTITVGFINADSSLSSADHIQFNTFPVTDNGGTLTNGDQFTINNPPYGPSGTFLNINPDYRLLYTNDTFNMTPVSIITLTCSDPISVIQFDMSKN